MYQLMASKSLYPSRFFVLLEELIIENLELGMSGLEPKLPSVIKNPQLAFEMTEQNVHRFEGEEIEAFGIFLAIDLFDYDWGGVSPSSDDPLPEGLIEKIKQRYHPDIQEHEHTAFDELLHELNVESLSNAYLEWVDFLDHVGSTAEVYDDFCQSWIDFCGIYHQFLLMDRVTFLGINTYIYDEDGTEYGAIPFDHALDVVEEDGFALVPHFKSCGHGEHAAPYCYVEPIRGGGFTCMN